MKKSTQHVKRQTFLMTTKMRMKTAMMMMTPVSRSLVKNQASRANLCLAQQRQQKHGQQLMGQLVYREGELNALG